MNEAETTWVMSAEEKILLSRIIVAMSDEDVPNEFLSQLDEHARVSRPVFRMANIWSNEFDGPDRDETISHLKAMFRELTEKSVAYWKARAEKAEADLERLRQSGPIRNDGFQDP